MKGLLPIAAWLAGAALSGAGGHAVAAPSPGHDRPNVIFILLDDLDIADVGAYGSTDIHTPVIDEVAAEGIRLDRFYAAAPVCSPTRASLITGEFPSRYGIKRAILDSSQRGLPRDSPSLPRLMQSQGYRTAFMGKWHLGTQKSQYLPDKKGFDHSVRLLTDQGLDYLDYQLMIDEKQIERHENGPHLTRTLTDYALRYLDDAINTTADKPFYLNLWYLAPHKPIRPMPPEFDNSHTGYCLKDESLLSDCDEDRGHYAALVSYADSQIGRVLDFLAAHPEVERNTLVIIASDNGGESGTHRSIASRQLRSYKGRVFEGGIRVPFVARWPGVISAGATNQSVISSIDLLPTLVDLSNGHPGVSGPGESFARVLTGNTLKPRMGPLVWENKHANDAFTNQSGVFNTYAIRDGDWKLVFTPARSMEGKDRTYLFNLASDPFERHSLLPVEPRPARGVKETASRLIDWLFPEEPQSSTLPSVDALVTHLRKKYLVWRQRTGSIEYVLDMDQSGIHQRSSHLEFNNGMATLRADERLSFDDGDFSFLTSISPEDVGGDATIAAKPGSWRLFVDHGTLKLVLRGYDKDKQPLTYQLQGALGSGSPQHVAFTVFGWRDDPSTVKLYVNGKLMDETAPDEGFAHWGGMDGDELPYLLLGNAPDGGSPYHGMMERPRISALSFYPSEVFFDYAKSSLTTP